MDRVNGNNYIDIGEGRRGFRSQNAAAGIAGTEVTDKILNDMQEEICAVIENAGLILDPQNQQQLWEALQSIAAPGFANRSAWLPVLSLTTTAPPNGATLGDAYIIPAAATGTWAGNQQKLAEWNGSSWRIVTTKDGHGVSLPDGRVFEKVGGTYVEKIALDVQSGKWNVATATGAANALAVALTPAPLAYSDGLIVAVRPSATTTSTNPTININGLGAKAITNPNGTAIAAGAIKAGSLVLLIYNSSTDKFNVITSDRQPGQAIAVLANGTNYDIPFGVLVETAIKVNATSLYDTNNAYSLANGTYTVPEAGIYVFSVNFSFDAPSNAAIRLWVKKNGVKFGESSTVSPRVLALTVNVRCEVGDVISLSADSSVAYTKAAMGPASYFASSFSGALLGK